MKQIWIAIACLMLAGAASAQEFRSYEARNPYRDGQGGERKTVEGIDIWVRGDPPRRYQLIGSLVDERSKSGLWGMIRMGSFERDIAKAAKKAGGDGVILMDESDTVEGVFGNNYTVANASSFGSQASGDATSFGGAFLDKTHNSRFMVIRYVPDPVPVAESPVAPPAAQVAAPAAQ